MPEKHPFGQEDARKLRDLPLGAAAAFTARCVRRILPLAAMDEEIDSYSTWLDSALFAIDHLYTEVGGYRSKAPRTIAAALKRSRNKLLGTSPKKHAPAISALCAIESAMKTIYPKPTTSVFDTAIKAIRAAKDYSEEAGVKVARAQNFDLTLLAEHCQSGDVMIRPGFFGSLWPEGPPAQWPGSEEDSTAKELVIYLDMPEGTADDDVLAIVEQTVSTADGLHRAYGGHGLMVERGNIDIERRVGTPVGVQP